jgi:hypothetical protein
MGNKQQPNKQQNKQQQTKKYEINPSIDKRKIVCNWTYAFYDKFHLLIQSKYEAFLIDEAQYQRHHAWEIEI